MPINYTIMTAKIHNNFEKRNFLYNVHKNSFKISPKFY